MSSTSETGHAKNVANFGTVVITLEGFGEKYNPSNEAIQLSVLYERSNSYQQVMQSMKIMQPPYTRAISDRDQAIAPLSKLVVKAVNALSATSAPAHIIQAAQALSKKITGTGSKPSKNKQQEEALAENGESAPKTISTSQLSIDNRINNFDSLIILLENTSEYGPNEEELQTANLAGLRDNLKILNEAAIVAAKAINNARIARNDVLYHPTTGVIATVKLVKAYLKSLYGIRSPQYKQISALAFKKGTID